MAGNHEEKFFTEGLDYDSDPHLKKGYSYALNIINGRNGTGDDGSILSVKGNLKIGNPWLNDGCKAIGSCEDLAHNSVVYFIYDPAGFHGIYRYFRNAEGYLNGVVHKLLRVENPTLYNGLDIVNPLNFQRDKLITGVDIIDNLLYWTDYHNRPRVLDIERADQWNKRQRFHNYFNKANFWNNNWVEGAELLPDPTFAGTIGTSWFLSPTTGSGWSIGSGATKVASVTQGQIQSTILPGIVYTNPPTKYRVSFTITGSNNIGGVTPIVGQTAGTPVTADGTYTQDIFAYDPPGNNTNTNIFTLSATANWAGTITVASCKVLTAQVITHYFHIYKAGAPLVYNFQFQTSADSFEQLCEDFMTFYTANTPAHALFTAINHGQWIEMEMADAGYYIIQHEEELFSGGTAEISLTVPANFYPDFNTLLPGPNYSVLVQDLIDRIRYPEVCQPSAVFKTDTTRNSNDVYQKVYQFRTRYNYYDFSRSTPSAISTIPIPDTDSNNPDIAINNYVEVDFTDPRLNDIALVSIIREVEILFREHNTGDWKIAAILQPYQFVGIGSQKFNFYNDTNSISVPPTDMVEPFESIGIKVMSQKIVDDRLFDGGIVEGYNKPDQIDARIDVAYEDGAIADKKLYTIKGRVFIRGMYGWNFQPIYTQSTNPNVVTWGGWSPGSAQPVPDPTQVASFNQFIPMQGFTFYLAGTEYHGTTKQRLLGNGIQQYGTGQYLSAITTTENNNIINALQAQGSIYHDFEIKNVPEGKYIMRIASHLITQADINNGSYQSTSTNVMSVGGVANTEVQITINDSTTVNGVFDSGYSEIADLLPGDTTTVAGLTGYVCDQDLGVVSENTFDANLTDTRIARAKLQMNLSGSPAINPSVTLFPSYPNIDWTNGISYADHNGYFFFASSSGSSLTPSFVYCGSTAFATWTGRVYQTNTVFNLVGVGTAQLITLRNTDTNVTDNCKTYVAAHVQKTNSLANIQGVVAVITNGAWQLTDGNGDVRIPVYIDSINYTNQKYIHLYLYSPSIILFLIPSYQDYLNLIQIGSSFYNKLVILDVTSKFFFDSINTEATCAFQRGWDGEFGLVYYDESDRRTFVATAAKVHINFFTEKVGNALLPSGSPTLAWEIFHRPPEWSVKWQWVRTENQNSIRMLQWIANSVSYINDNDDTNLGSNTASGVTQCAISLANIGYYTINRHPNSVINYTFEKGDRIRFIADEQGNLLNDYFEYEILKYVAPKIYINNDVSLFVKKGYLFEIYTPRNDSQIKFFYEFGECFDVGTAVINGVRQKYHKGLSQDQSFGISPSMPVTPATGTFRTGDVYYRRREMQIGAVVETDVTTASSEGNIVRAIIDQSISDFYESKDQSIGRNNTDYGDTGQQERPTAIRFSDRYISNTKTNGFSTFKALNYKQLSTDYGLIMRLLVTGSDVLHSVHYNSYKISMYINKNVLRAALGQQLIVAISDDVIAKSHETQRTFGTQHPESIVIDDEGDLFGWDERQGVMWRNSGNGMIPVSDYKMRSYFKPKSVRRINIKRTPVPAVYDLNHDLYIPTFIEAVPSIGVKPKAKCLLNFNDQTPWSVSIRHYPTNTLLGNATGLTDDETAGALMVIINANTQYTGFTATVDDNGYLIVTTPIYSDVYSKSKVVFTFNNTINYSFVFDAGEKPDNEANPPDEADTLSFSKEALSKNEIVRPNKWMSHYSFTPEFYCKIRNEIVMFVDGELWLAEANDLYNNFFDVQHVSQIEIPFNKDFQKVKVYKQHSQCPGEGVIDMVQRDNLCWYAPEITASPTQSRPLGFLSELKRNHFKHTYGNYHALILRNKLSPQFTDQLKALINGDEMQGEVLTILLENDSTKKVALFSTGVDYFYIEKS